MKILLFCLIVAHCVALVQPLRFIDRLPDRRFPIPKQCLIAQSTIAKSSLTPVMDMLANEVRPLFRVYAAMNCSIAYQEWTSVGKEDSPFSIDRLPGRRFPIPKRCLIAEADVAERFVTPDLRDMIVKEAKPLFRVYAAMNCSIAYQEWTSVGKEDSNGSYDGAIGYIQRNENDITGLLFPTDMFRMQPAFVATSGLTGGAVIVSKKNETQTQRLTLLRLWANSFDAITAEYVLIVVFLFVAVLSFIVSEKRLDAGRWMVNCMSNCCKATIALIGHGSLDPIDESGRIAVLFFNFFILFAVNGITLSTFGADLVYEIDPPIIESVDEFTIDSYTQPAVVKQLYFLEAMQKAEPGSPFWRLNQIVQSHANVSIWDVDINGDMNQLQQQADRYERDIDDSRSALISDHSGVDLALR